jgi:hypothetical protein
MGKPYMGNPFVSIDEGKEARTEPPPALFPYSSLSCGLIAGFFEQRIE